MGRGGRGGGSSRDKVRQAASYREPKPDTPATSSPASKWHVQDRTDDVTTKVGGGFDRDHQVAVTEFVIADRDGSGNHEHVVIDDQGNTIHDTTQGNG